jgi:hypothetical protein
MRALILIASPVALLQAQAAERVVPAGRIVVQTDDVTCFFKVLDANHGRPSADDLQHGYLDAGTDALRSFTDSRIGSMERLARAIQDKPSLFAKARTTALPSIRTRVAAAVDQAPCCRLRAFPRSPYWWAAATVVALPPKQVWSSDWKRCATPTGCRPM